MSNDAEIAFQRAVYRDLEETAKAMIAGGNARTLNQIMGDLCLGLVSSLVFNLARGSKISAEVACERILEEIKHGAETGNLEVYDVERGGPHEG